MGKARADPRDHRYRPTLPHREKAHKERASENTTKPNLSKLIEKSIEFHFNLHAFFIEIGVG
jgi:hypothetical protein